MSILLLGYTLIPNQTKRVRISGTRDLLITIAPKDKIKIMGNLNK